MLQREAHLRREIDLLAGLEQGSLTVGAGPFMAESSAARAIARLSMAHPRLRIRCVSADPADVLREVLAERFDLGVTAATGLDAGRAAGGGDAAAPAHLLRLPSRTPADAGGFAVLARALEFPLVTMTLRAEHAMLAATRDGTTPPQGLDAGHFVPQIQVNSMTAARLIARESNALVPGSAAILAEDVAAGRLVRLDVDAPAMRTDPGVFYLRGRSLAPAARAFIDTWRAIEAESAAADAPPRAGKSRPRGGSRR